MNRERLIEKIDDLRMAGRTSEQILDVVLPQVRTVEELEALPDGALVASDRVVFRFRSLLLLLQNVHTALDHEPADVLIVEGPLTIVWQP